MALNKKRKRSALGNVPLNKGIFQKTEPLEPVESNQESRLKNEDDSLLNQESRKKNKESIIKKQESSFLNKELEKEKVNFRIPIDLNDWLDDLIKQGKRKHGSKIPKEIWIQAALELFQKLPVDWQSIESIEDLGNKLAFLESFFLNLDIDE